MYDTETGTVVPLAMHGSTCHFKLRVPTKLELDTLPDSYDLGRSLGSGELVHTILVRVGGAHLNGIEYKDQPGDGPL